MVTPRLAAASFLAAQSLLAGACILDLGGLSDGEPDGGAGGSQSGGNGGGGNDGGGGAATCALLDCTACASSCPAGECAPTAIATAEHADGPWAIAAAGGSVYWVNRNGGTISRRAPGSSAPEVLTTAVSPVAIAVASGFVIWAEQDGVFGCPEETCDEQKTMIAPAVVAGSIRGVAFDGQFVYYTDLGEGLNMGRVRRCPPEACGVPLEIAATDLAPGAITLAGPYVIWADEGTGDGNGNVYRASKGGQDVTQIAGALVSPTSVVADDTYVYYTRWSDDGKVFRCPLGGTYCDSPEEIAPAAAPLARPFDLALGGGRVYWTSSGDGTIRSCPVAGCGQDPPRTHASGREGLRELSLGSSCVFWVDDNDGGGVLEAPR
jgi:hypothetical protein